MISNINKEFLKACTSNYYQNVLLAIANGADVNVAWDDDGNTGLIISSMNCNFNNVDWLLKCKKLEKEKTNRLGETALMVAAENKDWSIANILIEAKCNVNHRNLNNETALGKINKLKKQYERYQNSVEDLLIEAGATE